MNNIYLIFFGKSQDFSFHAFDSKSYVNDFNTIIKDFDELESKIFTVDDVSNTQILSKYIFNKNGRHFYLLKLYSLAQAFNGNRIDGSIYGVALLSENNIRISEANIAILESAKKEFAKLSLNGVKFKTSNFYTEAERIWRALTEHSNGNYLDKVEYNNFNNISINKEVKAFLVKDILKQSVELNNEITKTSRLYFSDDLAHLKRTQERRGKDVFPVYQKENGNYILYREKQPNTPKSKMEQDTETTGLRLENVELKRELADAGEKFKRFKQSATQKFRIASVAAAVFCLTALAFFFTGHFGDTQSNAETDTATVEPQSQPEDSISQQIQPQSGTVSLTDIMDDNNKRNILSTLLQNIKEHSNTTDKKKYYDAIVRDANALGINPAFAEEYRPEEKQVAPVAPTPIPTQIGKKETEPKKQPEKPKVEGSKKEQKKTEVKKEEAPKPQKGRT